MSGSVGPAAADVAASGSEGESDEVFITRISREVVRRRLTMPCILFLESVKPLNVIGSQFLYFLDPIVHLFVPFPDLPRIARLLEERDSIERLVSAIEAREADEGSDASRTGEAPQAGEASKPRDVREARKAEPAPGGATAAGAIHRQGGSPP